MACKRARDERFDACPSSGPGRPPAASRRTRGRAARRAGARPRRTAPPLGGVAADQASASPPAVARVETVGRLVHEQHVRRARDRPGERDPLRACHGPAAPRSATAARLGSRTRRAPALERTPALGRQLPGQDAQQRRLARPSAGRAAREPGPARRQRSTSEQRAREPRWHASALDLDAGLHSPDHLPESWADVLDEGPGSDIRLGSDAMEEAALAALDLDALARDAAELVRVPSVTGDERAGAGAASPSARRPPGSTPSCTSTTSPRCARIPATRARRRRATSCGA